MATRIPELSEEQRKILGQFREQVSDVIQHHHDDYFLLRWLRARQFDLEKAGTMLRESLEWRKKWSVDCVSTDWDPPEVLQLYWPGGVAGYDKEGYPVFIEPAGRLDMKGLTLSAKKEDIIRYNIYQVEQIYSLFPEQTDKMGRRIDKLVMINDLEGFTLKLLFSPGMDILLKVMALVEANYPEALKTCYIINAPRIFPLIYNICKPFLSEDTKRKIIILGADWKEKLLETIDADELPVHWGGMSTDPDGNSFCRSKVCCAGEVPHAYYLSEQPLVNPERLLTVSIAAGSAAEFKFPVTQDNCVLKWFFKTDSHDIGFQVTMRENSLESKKESDNGLKVLIPNRRVSCNNIPEHGHLECESLGTYMVKFDNCFSWINSKKLQYHIEVIQPDESLTDAGTTTCGTESPDSDEL